MNKNEILEKIDQIRGKAGSIANLISPSKNLSIRLTDAWQQAKSVHDELKEIVSINFSEEEEPESLWDIVISVLEDIEKVNPRDQMLFLQKMVNGHRRLSDAVDRESGI